ncbi:lactate permease LctP family transporter [Prauserella isguenensis]|uniref:lactate permease LctP family transporter n=1 Tax=Prauserella isguenensis TaxID=1470180 RepID=UPI001612CA5B
MYQPDTAPVGGSLALSALVAALPLVTVFVLLGVFRVKAHWAGLSALGTALVVAVVAYGMPVDLAALAATEGAAFGLFPILWIVLAAIWLYQLTVVSGRFEDLRAAFGRLSPDPRVQAIIIAFCFGGLLEALAGFGAPVAITGMMLVTLGFPPLRAAITVLLANTAPVAFGAMAIPIVTAGELTGIPYEQIGAVVGRQTPILALVVPLLLVAVVDGRRGIRQTWPAAVVTGAVFAFAQFVCSNYVSVELTDIVSSLAGAAALVVLLRFWQPKGSDDVRDALQNGTLPNPGSGDGVEPTGNADTATRTLAAPRDQLTRSRTLWALFPYLLVIGVFSVVKLWKPLGELLASTTVEIPWPGLHGAILTASGEPTSTTIYSLEWLSSPGTLLAVCGIVVAAAYRLPMSTATREFVSAATSLRWPALTVAGVLALAYVMNQSGQTLTIAMWIGGAGAAFSFLSPVLGWLGVAVTGSDTSANALFATLQQGVASKVGIDPTLLVAANSSGGVMGKMISPQNLTIATSAVGLVGRESDLFRCVVKWSLGLLLVLCALTALQASVLSWMLP